MNSAAAILTPLMKRTHSRWGSWILFVAATGLGITAQAQVNVYHPFPDSAVVWYQLNEYPGNQCCCSGSGPCLRDETTQFFLDGDTTMGGQLYHKLFQTGVIVEYRVGPMTCPPTCPGAQYLNHSYVGAIREDTTLRRVYYRQSSSFPEELLYDFNLVLGDTLPPAWNNPGWPPNYVSRVDSIRIGSSYRRQIWVSSYDTNYVALIEGIGSTYGLLSLLIPNNNVSQYNSALYCVTVSGLPIYPDTNSICTFVSGTHALVAPTRVSALPNPFSDHITLTGLSGLRGEFLLFDLASRCVFRQDVEQDMRIGTPRISPGIYFYEIRAGGTVIGNGRLVKE